MTRTVLGDDPRVGGFELGELPSSREIRRFAGRAARSRAGAGVGKLLSDAYTAFASVAITVLLGLGAVQQLRSTLPDAAPGATPASISLPVLVTVVLVAVGGALLATAGRLGPVGAEGPQASWWLPLPVDRRGLLRPAAVRLPAVAAVVGALVVLVLEAGLLARSGGALVRSTLLGAAASAAVVLVAGLAQSAGVARRRTALTGDVVLVGAPVAAAVVTALGAAPEDVPAPSWAAVAGLAVLVVVLAAVLDARLRDLPWRTLREGGAAATHALGALVSLDSRELGRALSGSVAPAVRRHVSRLRTVRGALTAIVTADLVVLRRSLRHVVQVVVAALLPVVVVLVPQLTSTVAVLLALVVGGAAAASASAEGARWAQMAPVVDRLLPLGDRTVRRARMVVPGGVALLWSLVALGAVGVWRGDLVDWLLLAVASAPVWAAAAVRAAYRPDPQWDRPLVATPAGALPMGVLGVLARGPDLVALCLLPLWVCVALGVVPSVAVTIQLALSAVAVVVASSTEERPLLERLMDDQSRRTGGAA